MTDFAATSFHPGEAGDPVRAVSVVSTGQVEIHPEHALGTRKPLYWWLLTSRRWMAPRPINVYVIEHERGLVVFDTPGRAWELVDPDEPADASVAPFTSSLDIFGDGSLVLLPTPGHTAGSTSLLVRRRSAPPLLMVGDLTYGADLLERGVLPGVGERSGLAASTAAVRELARSLPGLLVLPAHDPTASARLWAATAQDGAR